MRTLTNFCILFMLLMSINLKSQNTSEKKLQYGVYLTSSLLIKDHSGLDDLILNPKGIDNNVYHSGNLGLTMVFNQIRFLVDVQRSALTEEISESSKFEIMDVMSSISLGYDLDLSNKFKLTPTMGMSILHSRLQYLERSLSSSTTGFLNSPFGSNRLNFERYYAGVGVLASYRLDFIDKGIFPLDLIARINYREAISSAVWGDDFGNELNGENLMDKTLNFSLGFLWSI